MIFRSLTLTNFGTYAGENRIDLSPGADRPIVLVGGSNGSGKTTILEALLLCLHGRRALGNTVSLRRYEAHVASRIHTPPDGVPPPTEATLTIVLEHTEGGETSEYVVERTWKLTRTRKIQESLYLSRDGATVEDLPESSWQDFLDGLVPPGVANLFLFDGEQIQSLADDDTGEHLSGAVRRLLGLDVVGQLRIDLQRYVARAEGQTEATLAANFAKCEHELRNAEARVRTLRGERADAQARRDQIVDRTEREREHFAQQGGVLATERTKLEQNERAATERAFRAEAEVREMIAGLLPFAICPAVASSVDARLRAEQVDEENDVIRRRLHQVRARLSRAVTGRNAAKPAAQLIEEILLGRDSCQRQEARIHDLTPTERAVLADQLARVRSHLPPAASAAAKRLIRADEQRLRARNQLDKAPETSAVSDLLVKLQGLERQVGVLDANLTRLDDELHKARYEVTVAERGLSRAHDALRCSQDIAHRSGLALRAMSALEAFELRLQMAKLGEVELETARYFNRLSRKGELLSTVRLDPESLRISLERWDGSALPKERLSAGEKQLLAISLLWALAKTSGRPLPVVIDTPLARLDHLHRERLLREYFPRVSHQVIVLSTDTEVDASAAQELAPATVRAFHLDHDASRCQTTINDGYFFAMAEAANAG